jgi:hypothetical protein
MKVSKSCTTNEQRRQLKESKNSAESQGHSRKLLPVRTPLGEFANSYVAAKKHKISLWTFWTKVMDPRDNGFVIIDTDSLRDPG